MTAVTFKTSIREVLGLNAWPEHRQSWLRFSMGLLSLRCWDSTSNIFLCLKVLINVLLKKNNVNHGFWRFFIPNFFLASFRLPNHGTRLRTPALYPVKPGFETQHRDRLSWLECFRYFLSPRGNVFKKATNAGFHILYNSSFTVILQYMWTNCGLWATCGSLEPLVPHPTFRLGLVYRSSI